jgi:3-oxoacyl-[acyl-carrier protein] reductase
MEKLKEIKMLHNILLTGCSKGVGLSICETLLKNGYNVYGISRTINKQLENLLEEYPQQMNHLQFDLADTENIQNSVFKNWMNNSIPIHGFVNNAAIAYDDIITNLSVEKIKKMYDVNVFTPFLIIKYVLRNALFNKINCSIVHISSISVHTGYKGLAMYAGSKGALEAFSKNTSREWGERGVRSNCIVAGFMDTEMSSTLDQDKKERIYKRNSLKKPTTIESVAHTVEYLLSNKSASITGQNIFVDSGTI